MTYFTYLSRYLAAFVLILSCLLLTGCAGRESLFSSSRFRETTITKEDTIGIIVVRYSKCVSDGESKCESPENLQSAQKEFSDCLGEAIHDKDRQINVVPLERMQPIFSKVTGTANTVSEEGMLAILRDPGLQTQFAALHLRYLVALDVETEKRGKHTVFAPGQGVWAAGKESSRISRISAAIYDVSAAARAGALGVVTEGESGFAVPVVVIIPLPPIPYSTMTETTACKQLGVAVAQFFQHPKTTPAAEN